MLGGGAVAVAVPRIMHGLVSVRGGWFRPAVYSCRLKEAREAGQPTPDRTAGEVKCWRGGGGDLLQLVCPKQYLM